jgi:DNA-binding IclR family transcriptional regulator
MGMPRTTVIRKLLALKRRGLVEQYGTKFVLSIDGINSPHLLEGFAKRLVIVRASLSRMLVALPTELTRTVHDTHTLDTGTVTPR